MFSTDPATTSSPSRGSQSIQPATAPRSPRTGRRIAVDSVLGGLLLPLIGFAVADVINPDWSPVEATSSHYVHAPRGGWLIQLGTLVMAVASGTLTWLVAAHTRGGRAGLALLGVWTAGLLVAGVFPTDPPGSGTNRRPWPARCTPSPRYSRSRRCPQPRSYCRTTVPGHEFRNDLLNGFPADPVTAQHLSADPRRHTTSHPGSDTDGNTSCPIGAADVFGPGSAG